MRPLLSAFLLLFTLSAEAGSPDFKNEAWLMKRLTSDELGALTSEQRVKRASAARELFHKQGIELSKRVLAHVTAVRGEVMRLDPHHCKNVLVDTTCAKRAVVGMEVKRGHRFVSGPESAATLTFLDGSQLAMRDNTIMILDGAETTDERAWRGGGSKPAGEAKLETAKLETGKLRDAMDSLSGKAAKDGCPKESLCGWFLAYLRSLATKVQLSPVQQKKVAAVWRALDKKSKKSPATQKPRTKAPKKKPSQS